MIFIFFLVKERQHKMSSNKRSTEEEEKDETTKKLKYAPCSDIEAAREMVSEKKIEFQKELLLLRMSLVEKEKQIENLQALEFLLDFIRLSQAGQLVAFQADNQNPASNKVYDFLKKGKNSEMTNEYEFLEGLLGKETIEKFLSKVTIVVGASSYLADSDLRATIYDFPMRGKNASCKRENFICMGNTRTCNGWVAMTNLREKKN